MKIKNRNLTDQVIQHIKAMILNGTVEPGGYLVPQPELATELGVGLSTIREAIKGLALLGIVDPQPGRGTFIHPEAPALIYRLDVQQTLLEGLDIDTIYEARKLVEVELAGLAAERATAQQLAEIREALDQMRLALKDNDRYMETDMMFHLAVARAADNSLLEEFYFMISDVMAEINFNIADVPGVKSHGLQIQEDIFNAIESRQPQLARQQAAALVNRWRGLLRAFRIQSTDIQQAAQEVR